MFIHLLPVIVEAAYQEDIVTFLKRKLIIQGAFIGLDNVDFLEGVNNWGTSSGRLVVEN